MVCTYTVFFYAFVYILLTLRIAMVAYKNAHTRNAFMAPVIPTFNTRRTRKSLEYKNTNFQIHCWLNKYIDPYICMHTKVGN